MLNQLSAHNYIRSYNLLMTIYVQAPTRRYKGVVLFLRMIQEIVMNVCTTMSDVEFLVFPP